jgi:hypothetical protein
MNMQILKFSKLRLFASHFFPIALLFLFLGFFRYPLLLNSEYTFNGDEGLLASTIWDIFNNGSIIFYYDIGRTFGLTFGLAAVPFMWFLGPTSLAFNLPAPLFYALYVWTTFLVAKKLIPRTAYLVLILMLFTPFRITELTMYNWPHVPAAFLGNCMFLLFIKFKLSKENENLITFLLFFTMGLAIYTYTYSFIFILTIAIVHLLTHSKLNQFKEQFSLGFVVEILKNKKSKKDVVCQLLDMLIFVFVLAVGFSYIFGGFGLDIGGVSILQINKFHGAAIQLSILIVVRFMISPKNSITLLKNIQSYFIAKLQVGEKRMIVAGMVGFVAGLSPRIASILNGETSKGGQGHDMDFLPTKLLAHLHSLLFNKGPQLFDIEKAYRDLIVNPINISQSIFGFLFVALIAILLISFCSFAYDNKGFLKSIMTLRGMSFEPVHLIIMTPIIVCFANIVVQNGPEPRYLFPLFGTFVLMIGIFADKIILKFKYVSVIILLIWMGFYSISNYRSYQDAGLIKDAKLVKFERSFIYELIDFLVEKNISVAYSDFSVSGMATYLSGGKLNVSEYFNNPVAKTRKKRGMQNPDFAIIADEEKAKIYGKFLRQNNVDFKVAELSEYKIYWEFSGDYIQIDKLRSLIHEN